MVEHCAGTSARDEEISGSRVRLAADDGCPSPNRVPSAPPRALCPILVGRDRQVEQLDGWLRAALEGAGAIAVLAGEAGIGKSRLAGEIRDRAADLGAHTMLGACSEVDLALPYLPFIEALGNFVTTAGPAVIREQLSPGAVRALAELFPQLSWQETPAPAGDATQGRLRFFEAVVETLRLASKPTGLLLLLEDIHWADPSTLELLAFVARRLPPLPVLVVVTYRTEELDPRHPLRALLQQWRRSGTATLITLGALPTTAVGAMLSAIFEGTPVTEEMSHFLHDRTDGNPFAIEEFVKAALDRGDIYRTAQGWERHEVDDMVIPATVSAGILGRLEQLDHAHAEVLRCASVLGSVFPYRLLEATSEAAPETVRAATEVAIRELLLAPDPARDGGFRFRHALTRDAVYADMIHPRRAALHLRVVDAMRTLGDAHPVDIAHHLIAAGRLDEAAPLCLEAAEEAMRRHALPDAAGLYRRALAAIRDPGSRARVLCRLGEAEWLVDEVEAAQRSLEEGIDELLRLGDVATAAHYRLILGRCCWQRMRTDLALQHYAEARDELEPLGPSVDLALAHVRLSQVLAWDLHGADSEAIARQAIAIAEKLGIDLPRIFAHNYLGSALINQGQVEAGMALQRRSWEEAIAADEPPVALVGLLNAFHYAAELLRLDVCRSVLQPLRALAAVNAKDTHVGALRLRLDFLSGRLRGSEQACARVEQALGDFGNAPVGELFRAWLVAHYVELDLDGEAARNLRGPGGGLGRVDHERARAWLLYHGHLGGDAVAALPAAETVFAGRHRTIYRPLTADFAVEVLLATGRRAEAEELTAVMAEPDCNRGNPCVARMRGRLAAASGDTEAARSLFVEAADAFDGAGYLLEGAWSRFAQAEALLAAGDHEQALVTLRGLVPRAEEAGASLLLRRVADAISGTTRTEPAVPSAAAAGRPGGGPPAVVAGVFRRQGDYWVVGLGTEVVNLAHVRGLEFLAELLRRPGTEVHALELVAGRLPAGRGDAPAARDAGLAGVGSTVEAGLDTAAVRDYRERILELGEELAEAETFHDPGRAERARAEIDFLEAELGRAFGLGGRPRQSGTDPERARVNVTRAIRGAITRVTAHSPRVGEHLAATVHTGLFCVYRPDPLSPTRWSL